MYVTLPKHQEKIVKSGNQLIRFGYINEKDINTKYMWLKDVTIVQNE